MNGQQKCNNNFACIPDQNPTKLRAIIFKHIFMPWACILAFMCSGFYYFIPTTFLYATANSYMNPATQVLASSDAAMSVQLEVSPSHNSAAECWYLAQYVLKFLAELMKLSRRGTLKKSGKTAVPPLVQQLFVKRAFSRRILEYVYHALDFNTALGSNGVLMS